MIENKTIYKNIDLEMVEDPEGDIFLNIAKDGIKVARYWIFANTEDDGELTVSLEEPEV